MANIEEECKDLINFESLTINELCVLVISCFVRGLMMDVMAFVFAIPLRILKSLWIAKNSEFLKFFL